MKILSILKSLGTAVALLATASTAFAHAISIGYENAGSPGSVNIWLGTYEHGGHHTEGSLNLVGVNGNSFASTTVAFSQLVNVKPSGLIDGTTNFFAQYNGSVPNNLPLINDESSWLNSFPSYPVNHWMGVTFTGLGAGDYQFTWVPAPNPTAEWSPLSSQMNGIFTLGGSVVNGVPDSGSTFGMIALGLVALTRFRRKAVTA